MIIIKKASLSDIKSIQKVAQETWPVAFEKILSPEQIEYMLNMMYSTQSLQEQIYCKGHLYLLAEDNEMCLGYVSIETNYKLLSITKVHKIYVLPNAQGRGIGKLLLQKTEQIAEAASNAIVSLNINRDNTAINFYKKMGFDIVSEENISIGSGFVMEDYVMQKILG